MDYKKKYLKYKLKYLNFKNIIKGGSCNTEEQDFYNKSQQIKTIIYGATDQLIQLNTEKNTLQKNLEDCNIDKKSLQNDLSELRLDL